MKKPAVVSGAVLLAVVAVLVGSSSDGRAQMQIQPLNGWSYAYLANANIYGSALEVAYVEDGKCRIEKFYEPVNQPFRSDINLSATRSQSAAVAMTALMRDRLGNGRRRLRLLPLPG